MKKCAMLMLLSAVTAGCTVSDPTEKKMYEADWSSLRTHEMPEWMDGMKFGIYCHWGPQTLQHQMGPEATRLDAIEHWTGEKFDAKVWVDLFEAAGAQFAGPVAWHGSGLLNWDSEITDWNTVNKGPGIDIVGDLVNEIRSRDLKVLASFHNNKSIWGTISKNNPAYLNPEEEESPLYTGNDGRRDDALLDGWLDRVSEAVDKYDLDMVWVDTSFGGTVGSELQGRSETGRHLPGKDNQLGTIKEEYQQKMLAHYFNRAAEQGREVEFIYKSFDIPPGIGMRDIENGSLQGLQYDPWMADINMAINLEPNIAWFYNPKNPMKDANSLVDLLIDLTSKNGRMLLSVPPRADGTFTADQVKQLTAMGDWLKINGEAIYNTIPWTYFGEGPTEETKPGHHNHGLWDAKDQYVPKWTNEDIRFTQNGKNLYAIVMDWPGDDVKIRVLGSAGKLYPGDIQSISLLGSDATIHWTQAADALRVKFPKEKPCDFAYVLKILRK